jgi:hypothetical protein
MFSLPEGLQAGLRSLGGRLLWRFFKFTSHLKG